MQAAVMAISGIGELLVKAKLITRDQLKDALGSPDVHEKFIGTILVEKEYLSEDAFIKALSQQYGVPIIELEDTKLDNGLSEVIPSSLAMKHGLIPVVKKENAITVAMYDPSNVAALNEIKFVTGLDVKVVLASERAIRDEQDRAIDDTVISVDDIMNEIEEEDELELVESEEEVNLADLERSSEDAPVVKLVNAVLADAIKRGASDIHIEPYEKTFRVRFRVDGVLHEIMRPPIKLKNAITSRIKIMAELDISERRLPQDLSLIHI